MTAPKHEAKKLIDTLPEDSSYTEIIQALAMDKMIRKGLKDSHEGKTLSNIEMKKRIQQW